MLIVAVGGAAIWNTLGTPTVQRFAMVIADMQMDDIAGPIARVSFTPERKRTVVRDRPSRRNGRDVAAAVGKTNLSVFLEFPASPKRDDKCGARSDVHGELIPPHLDDARCRGSASDPGSSEHDWGMDNLRARTARSCGTIALLIFRGPSTALRQHTTSLSRIFHMDWWHKSSDDLVFLCGAGISRPPPSALPTVYDFLRESVFHCARNRAVAQELESQLSSPNSPRFEALIDAICKFVPRAANVGCVFDSPHSGPFHAFLAAQCAHGACVITTNFDNCIEQYLPADCCRLIFDGTDIPDRQPLTRALVKPHGSNPLHGLGKVDDIAITIRSLGLTAQGFQRFPGWRQYLLSAINDRTLIVLGYSGSDDFDIIPVLRSARPKAVHWVEYQNSVCPPVELSSSSATAKVRQVCEAFNAHFYRGIAVLDVPPSLRVPLRNDLVGRVTSCMLLHEWLTETFPDVVSKDDLFATIAFHHAAPQAVLNGIAHPSTVHESALIGRALYWQGKHAEALTVLEACKGRESLSPYLQETAYVSSACRCYVNDLDGAIEMANTYLDLCDASGDVYLTIGALNNLGGVLTHARRFADAREAYNSALRSVAHTPSLDGQAAASWGLGALAGYDGQWKKAEEMYLAARETYRLLGAAASEAWTNRNLAEANWRRGKTAVARMYVNLAERAFEASGKRDGLAYVLFDKLALLLLEAEYRTARETLRHFIDVLEGNGGFPVAANAIVAAYIIGYHCDDDTVVPDLVRALRVSTTMYITSRIPDHVLAREVMACSTHRCESLRERAWKHLFVP
jgi:tetratricopeptide (TPR) repeat protein